MLYLVGGVWKCVKFYSLPPALRPPKQNYIMLVGLSWITVGTT